jgi:hypothetical protein
VTSRVVSRGELTEAELMSAVLRYTSDVRCTMDGCCLRKSSPRSAAATLVSAAVRSFRFKVSESPSLSTSGYDGVEIPVQNFEVLVGKDKNFAWRPAADGHTSEGAISTGPYGCGCEELFIGRAPHMGSMTVGKGESRTRFSRVT